MRLLLSPPRPSPEPPRLALIVWITICGTFPIHVFVPALPSVAQAFRASNASAQLTITIYIIGLSIGQLVYGPLSDRFGRRPVLLCGLALFASASVVAAASLSLLMLVTARFFQGLGGCAGLVLGRAIARDGVSHDRVAGRLALLSLAMSVSPAMAPLIGAQLTAFAGWRVLLVILSIANMGVFLATALTLDETHVQRRAHVAGAYLANYWRLCKSRAFSSHALGGACATTSFYAFVAASPFIFIQQLHVSTRNFGLVYLAVIAGLSAGSWTANRVAGNVRASHSLLFAGGLMIASSLAMLSAFQLHAFTPAVIAGCMIVFIFGTGLASPFALTEAINADPPLAGSASGLYGFVQMSFGALCTGVVEMDGSHPSMAMILVLLVSALLATGAFAVGSRPRVDTKMPIPQTSLKG